MPNARLAAPSRGDGIVKLASEFLGGPVGHYAGLGRRGWAYVAAVLSSLASVLVALGVLQKNHCVNSGWATPGSLWRACYSDLPAVGAGPTGSTPWAEGGVGHTQPVLTALFSWVLRHLVPGGESLAQQRWYFAIAAVVIALLVAATVVATASIARSTPWLAAHVALSPVLITASLISFDILGVALMTLGIAAWARQRPLVAGLLLGSAVMARSFPALVLVAVVLVGWREGRTKELPRLLIGAAGAIAAWVGLAYAMGGDPLEPYQLWGDQASSYGSLWLVAQIAKITIPANALTIISVVGWAMALIIGGYLATDRRRNMSVAAVALVMLVVVMITGKALPVQAALWVLPLIALSGLRWRDHLLWAGAELAYFAGVWMYVGTSFNAGRSLPGAAYAVLTMFRLIALVGLAWSAVLTDDEMEDDGPPAPRRDFDIVAPGPTGHDPQPVADLHR